MEQTCKGNNIHNTGGMIQRILQFYVVTLLVNGVCLNDYSNAISIVKQYIPKDKFLKITLNYELICKISGQLKINIIMIKHVAMITTYENGVCSIFENLIGRNSYLYTSLSKLEYRGPDDLIVKTKSISKIVRHPILIDKRNNSYQSA